MITRPTGLKISHLIGIDSLIYVKSLESYHHLKDIQTFSWFEVKGIIGARYYNLVSLANPFFLCPMLGFTIAEICNYGRKRQSGCTQ
jgi:hypothetical protein